MPQPILSKILEGDRQKQRKAADARNAAEAERTKQTARYYEILRASHTRGDADADELRQLIDTLGKSSDDIESDLRILNVARETAAAVADLPRRELASLLAKLSVERHFAEMQRFWKSGKKRAGRLNDALNLCESELHSLEGDAENLRQLRGENPELLGNIGPGDSPSGVPFPDLLKAYAAKHMADLPRRFVDRFLQSPEWVNFHELEFKLRDEYENELDAAGRAASGGSQAAGRIGSK